MNTFIKVIKALLNALMTLILIVGILFIVLFTIGIKPYVVESGSMQPTIQTGSLSFVNTKFSYDNIKENDIIAFKNTSGTPVTHRVIKITQKGFETKGDSNTRSDGITTTKGNYIGKTIYSIPKLGYAVGFIQTTKGKIILITLIVIIFASALLIGDKNKHKGKRFKE